MKSTVPTWGAFVVTAIMAVLAVVWRLHDEHTSVDWSNLSIFLPSGIMVAALIVAAVLNWKASKQHNVSSIESAPIPRTTPSKTAPVIGIAVREVVVEPYDQTPGRHYPRKLRLYCSNDGDDIQLGIGVWVPDQIGLQVGQPPVCSYEIKDNLGRWSGEAPSKYIASGKWFRLYVGLDSRVSDRELDRMKTQSSFGTLEISAEVSGVAVKIRIRP
jgi:hypothetical protein